MFLYLILRTSSTPGEAMKCEIKSLGDYSKEGVFGIFEGIWGLADKNNKCNGATFGKAMESSSGKEIIIAVLS